MRTGLIIVLLIFGKCSFSQIDTLTKNFLTNIIKRTADTSIIGYTKTIGFDYYAYLPKFLLSKGKVWDYEQKRNVLHLTKKERRSIEGQVIEKRNLEWGDSLLPRSELIKPGSAELFIKHFPTRDIYQFTYPIFVRNNTLALILIKHHYPSNTKGYEETVLFQRDGDVWRRVALIKRDEWGF